MGDRLVVGNLDNREEVVGTGECVLRDDGAAEVLDLGVDLGETFRVRVERLTAFGVSEPSSAYVAMSRLFSLWRARMRGQR